MGFIEMTFSLRTTKGLSVKIPLFIRIETALDVAAWGNPVMFTIPDLEIGL